MSRPSRVLGLFAKEPRAGCVKTRLAAATSAEWAAQVANAFLRDVLPRFAMVEAERVLAYAPSEARPFFAALAGSQFRLTPQTDGDLGRRMEAFLSQQLQAGPVVLI